MIRRLVESSPERGPGEVNVSSASVTSSRSYGGGGGAYAYAYGGKGAGGVGAGGAGGVGAEGAWQDAYGASPSAYYAPPSTGPNGEMLPGPTHNPYAAHNGVPNGGMPPVTTPYGWAPSMHGEVDPEVVATMRCVLYTGPHTTAFAW